MAQLELIDGPVIKELDTLVELVAANLDCPTAVVSLLDEDLQWFKSRTNLESDRRLGHVQFLRRLGKAE